MFLTILMKMTTYAIIFVTVRTIVDKVFGLQKEHKADKLGNEYVDRRIFSNIYLISAIVLSIVLIVVGSFPSNVHGTTKLVMATLAIAINLLIYVVSIMYRLWYIKFEADGIIYRNMLGRTKKYNYDCIECVEITDYNLLKLRISDKSVIRIGYCEGQVSVIGNLAKHGVKPIVKSVDNLNGDEYVMEVTNLYKGLSWVYVIGFAVFVIMSIYTNYWIGILFFGIMFVVSIVDLLNKLNKKIIVSKTGVVLKAFLRKDREIPFKKIKYIKRKISDNAEIVYAYSEDGLEFKYSKLYKNAGLFENVIKKYKWKCM